MKAATVNEIKRALGEVDQSQLVAFCLRLAKYKKENKELLTYLLFESSDEQRYVNGVKEEMDELFAGVSHGNVYFVKKNLRKILRVMNRFVRYTESSVTELELRLHFCLQVKRIGIPIEKSQVLMNMFDQQIKKLNKVLTELPEDLRFDYQRELGEIGIEA